MTRWPALWSLLTGKSFPDPRDQAMSDYMAACVRNDTRAKRLTLEALKAAATQALGAGR